MPGATHRDPTARSCHRYDPALVTSSPQVPRRRNPFQCGDSLSRASFAAMELLQAVANRQATAIDQECRWI
jgi:hypothetical protein